MTTELNTPQPYIEALNEATGPPAELSGHWTMTHYLDRS